MKTKKRAGVKLLRSTSGDLVEGRAVIQPIRIIVTYFGDNAEFDATLCRIVGRKPNGSSWDGERFVRSMHGELARDLLRTHPTARELRLGLRQHHWHFAMRDHVKASTIARRLAKLPGLRAVLIKADVIAWADEERAAEQGSHIIPEKVGKR